MDILLSKIEYSDAIEVNNFLKNSKSMITNRVLKELLDHIENGICYKMVVNDKLVAAMASIEFDTYVSISFFKVADEIKGRPLTLQFYKYVCTNVADKPLIIKSKDITSFKTFVVPVDNVPNTYYLRRI